MPHDWWIGIRGFAQGNRDCRGGPRAILRCSLEAVRYPPPRHGYQVVKTRRDLSFGLRPATGAPPAQWLVGGGRDGYESALAFMAARATAAIRRRQCRPWGISMDVMLRVVIRGRVQGIGYRAWTEVTAVEHGLEGWVRNCRDGSVEALFAGPKEVVLEMIELCRQGPPGARVDGIDHRAARSEDLALRRRGELFSVLATV